MAEKRVKNIIIRKGGAKDEIDEDRKRWRMERDRSKANMEITRECIDVWRANIRNRPKLAERLEAFIRESAQEETGLPVGIEFDRAEGTVLMTYEQMNQSL